MAKYMAKKPMQLGYEDLVGPGDVIEIKKLKHPVVINGKKHKYIEVNTQHFMNKKFIKDNFTKGTYKSETPNRLLKTLLIIALFELSKYVTNEIIIKLQANDDIDQPKDYEEDK
ncbi:transcriptional activator RinB [Staphylococcus sp. GDX8P107P-1]|uniref:transcriptional activator RinB n=1 Tax=Staphylococcus sp. GDX8P107P-1 TaxID=2804109 RepID=UPI001FD8752D|nr:transcriptional activator RinB [Staphylococcus sp. GDX8P107P-1]